MAMATNLTRKILAAHLVEGDLRPGEEIAIAIDQTLTQDATGTMAYLQFEAIGVPRVATELSVSYVDHQLLQADSKNADDHAYLQDVAARYGIYFSRPGNGICHQVHLERFGVPGKTLLGSDSHTPTGGGLGMLAIGAGGLDIALAMAGEPFRLTMPLVVGVELRGRFGPWLTAKDVILELLRRLTVKGGVGRVFEYFGPGAAALTVPERSTITNMGAELGATTSIFPSDDQTRRFLRAQGREEVFVPLSADPGAEYDERIVIDLDALEPLIACPPSPDNVVPVSELAGTPVDQVAIGSCTNSSYQDLMTVARILRGRVVQPRVSLVINPGSRQVYRMIASNGALNDLLTAGVRLLESFCGPCAGQGQVPASDAVSLRSYNRNFPGRSGVTDARVYLASPALCAVAAIEGAIADPRSRLEAPRVSAPHRYAVDDRLILPPAEDPESVTIRRGPNIKPFPTREVLPPALSGPVLLKLGANISTDQILGAAPHILALRSNVPAISEFLFRIVDPDFVTRAKAAGGGVIGAGYNYGQGSSREHAALAPMYLGIWAILARGFARIHKANLVNFGILPLEIGRDEDYDRIQLGARCEWSNVREALTSGVDDLSLSVNDAPISVRLSVTPRQRQVLLAGGLFNFVRQSAVGSRQ